MTYKTLTTLYYIHGKNKGERGSGGNRKESPGKEVEVVWACVEKRGTLRRKEGDGNRNTTKRRRPKKRWLDRVRDVIKEKGLSAKEVYVCATWRRMSSYIDPT